MKNIISEKRAICGICPAGCWIIVGYDDKGRLAAVRPEEGAEFGITCRLGETAPSIVYAESRLQYPLRRTGPKGTFEFERVSWDSAYDIIVENLNRTKARHGAEAAAIYTGRGSFELAMCDLFQPRGVAVSSASSVLFPFGSPNTFGVGSLCYVSFAMIAPHVTMGGMLIDMFSDIENGELIVVWGANPATDSPPLDFRRISAAVERGAQLVVIDPRRTRTAKLPGAQWIPIRPGTDGALALGLCQVLLEEELYDEVFVRDWTHGFTEFAAYVQHFRPEAVTTITGVPAETVRSLARSIAGARGAAPVMYSGLEYSDSGVQAIRATFVLWALAGQIDTPGGRCFRMKENHFRVNREGLVPNPDVKKALGRDRFPLYTLYRDESHPQALPDAVLSGRPYPVKSLLILGASLITSWPQPEIWRRTLAGLDFLACIDVQLTADAAYADIVLPAATMFEIDSYMTYGSIFRLRERVIPPLGEARQDFFIMAELARRLGYGHLYPQNEEELLRHVLKGSGFTIEDVRAAGGIVSAPSTMLQYRKWEKGLLRPDGKPGFDTPTGKFEIASTILEEHGYDPLPVYTEPQEGPLEQPDLARRYPLVFNSGSRVTTDFRSQFHAVPELVRERPEPAVTMHPADAAERRINNGDQVIIKTLRGQVSMRAMVTEDIMPGTIDANMGGGGPVGPPAWQENNVNELTDLDRSDPISGFPVYKALLCQVEKVADDRATLELDSGESAAAAHSITKPLPPRQRIYLDHNATTAVAPEVQELMTRWLQNGFGNPSSIHQEGRTARFAVETARRSVARVLNCTARRLIFTGSGSEANNLALKGVFMAPGRRRNRIITSRIEHPSILATCAWLEENGCKIEYLDVDRQGLISPIDLERVLADDTLLVSVMTASNETGVLQPIAELCSITHRFGALFHTDAVQAVGRIPLDIEELGVDLLSLSGHKIHGPKGIGALYVRKGTTLSPLIHGGSQESALRAGTENVPAIVGLGRAVDLAIQLLPQFADLRALRDRLQQLILKLVPGATVNSGKTERLPNTLNITLPGWRGESIVLAMDQKGIALSSGSACRSGNPRPSPALLAMGLSDEEAHSTLRFSLGVGNRESDIDATIAALAEILSDSRSTAHYVPCR